MTTHLLGTGLTFLALLCAAPGSFAQDKAAAKAIYEATCAGCHGPGILGAPKLGDAAQWAPRAKAGIDALVKSATAGTPKGMPPKGGRADLTPAQLRSVIEYMISGGAATPSVAAAPKAAVKPDAKAAPAKVDASAPPQRAGAAAPCAQRLRLRLWQRRNRRRPQRLRRRQHPARRRAPPRPHRPSPQPLRWRRAAPHPHRRRVPR